MNEEKNTVGVYGRISELSNICRAVKGIKRQKRLKLDTGDLQERVDKVEDWRTPVEDVVCKYSGLVREFGFCLDIWTFGSRLKSDPAGLVKAKEDLEELLVNIFGMEYDNAASMFVHDVSGRWFKVSIHAERNNAHYSIHLYDTTGATYLMGDVYKVADGVVDAERVIAKMQTTMKMWSEGKIRCARCGKYTDYQKAKFRRYFAGLYCGECWENSIKEKAANESYN